MNIFLSGWATLAPRLAARDRIDDPEGLIIAAFNIIRVTPPHGASLLLRPCMSRHWSGTMYENAGAVPFAMSLNSCSIGTCLANCAGSFCTSSMYGNGLCLTA
jgi:hypothetical protein